MTGYMIGALLMITVFKYSIIIGILWSQMTEDEYIFVNIQWQLSRSNEYNHGNCNSEIYADLKLVYGRGTESYKLSLRHYDAEREVETFIICPLLIT